MGAYLDIEGIVEMAKERGVNYIHPGYGFLAENADFAEACAKAGLPLWGHARSCCARWATNRGACVGQGSRRANSARHR